VYSVHLLSSHIGVYAVHLDRLEEGVS